MAGELGERVVLEAPVRRITHSAEGVSVESDTVAVKARRAVVAVPPLLTARISYDPPLPPQRAGLAERMQPSSVIKVNVVYDQAFWRSDGLSGQVMEPGSPVSFTLDNSPSDGSPGILAGFIEAAQAPASAVLGQRSDVASRLIASSAGLGLGQPLRSATSSWTGRSRNGRAAAKDHMPLRGWTTFGPALRAPCGRIHWAGAETAVHWYGYMDGAVRSGHRAASETLGAITDTPS